MFVIRPHITEKSLLAASRGWYTFVVDEAGSKEAIAREINSLYNVHVLVVRTVSMHGKVRRVGRYSRYMQKPDWKKAIVKLKAGEKIDVFEVAPTAESAPAPKKEEKESKKK